MKRIFEILTILLLTVAAVSCGASKQLTAEQQSELRQMVDNKDFKVNVHRAYPMSGQALTLTSPYALTVRGDSVNSYLPYFGRGYSLPYGGGVGLHFEGKVNKYSVVERKRDMTEVTLDVSSPDDRLTYTLEVWPNGTVSILVTPHNRQSIRFDGEIELESAK